MEHLAILLEHRPGGHSQVHAGLAEHGIGHTMCNDRKLFEFALPAADPNFARHLADGWRHRYAEAFLERNDGCRACLDVLAIVGKEAGWATPRNLAV